MQEVAAQFFYLAFYRLIVYGVLSPAAVSRVADYGVAYVGEVHADLMSAARLYLHFQKRELGKPVGHFKQGVSRAARAASEH